MLYVVNNVSLLLKPGLKPGKYWVYARQISREQAIALLKTTDFVVGDEVTASTLSDLLGVQVANKAQVELGVGDEELVVKVNRKGYDFWWFSIGPALS